MPKSLTIAFVCDAIYPYNKGGKETRLYEITTRLANRGHSVHIYCMQWWRGKPNRIENKVHLHGICPYVPLYDGPRRSIKQGILFGLSCFKLLFAHFDVIDVDHMPFFPIFSVRVVCWVKRKKLIGTWNEVWGEEYWKSYLQGNFIKAKLASIIEQWAVKLPNEIFAISPHTKQKIIDTFHISKEKIVIVPCGYNSETIAESPISSEKSDIIYVGRLLSHKHVEALIAAVHELKTTKPNIICCIVGSGPEKKRLRQLTKELQLDNNIIFHGKLEKNEDVFSLMKASKVFVLPSTREGFGIVVLEANACGLPVLAIDHPDNAAREISQILSTLNTKDLAKNIEYMIENPQGNSVRSRMEENILKYSWTLIIEKQEEVYLS